MKEKNLISVIMPIYNSEKYLKKSISSIINQSYKNIELLLIDDCSSDFSLDICYSFQKNDKRIIIIHLNENLGVSNARNVGIDNVSGDYFMFVDSDDCISKNFIQKLSSYLNTSLLPRGFSFNKNKIVESNLYIKKLIYGKILGTSCGYLINKNKTKSIRFNINTNYMEDSLYILDVIKKYSSIIEVKDVLYEYQKNELSITNSYNDLNKTLYSYYYSIDEMTKKCNIFFSHKLISKRKVNILKDVLYSSDNEIEIFKVLSNKKLFNYIKLNKMDLISYIFITFLFSKFGFNYIKFRKNIKNLKMR